MFEGNAIRYLNGLSSMFNSRFITHKPFFLAHAITYACNSRCKTCTYWRMSNQIDKNLKTEEIFDLLVNAYNIGMRGYYLFGGEPLVMKDIEEILSFAKRKGFITTMNTNASLLKQKAESLSDNLDFAFVSLDYPDTHHDYIRGRKGSFDEVVGGIKRLQELGKTRITLVSTIGNLNFDKIEAMAQFAVDLGIGISYNAVEPTVQSSFEEGRTDSVVKNYGLSSLELQKFYETLLRLKKEKYPLMETEQVIRDHIANKPFKCYFPKIFVYVSPDGKIFSCTYDHTYDLKT
ncbi:radical SAM protein, partial [Candidatus Bathyarchaeota archaeon]|nr:radical SAM protein [Candidatus Bathyarchaeota archaeon]